MGDNRSVMVNEYLEKCESMLHSLAMACHDVYATGISWNKACEKRGFNSLKARNMLISTLPNCSLLEPISEELMENVFDGSWLLYRGVFGNAQLEESRLPFDYEKSVDYVLKTLDSQLEDILRRHFGLAPYEELQTFAEIAEAHGITQAQARNRLNDALRILRRKKTREILVYGLRKYQHMQENAKKAQEQEIAQMQAQHDAMIKKRQEAFERLMEKVENGTFNEALELLAENGLAESLKNMSAEVLDLPVRAANGLRRNGIKTVYDLVMMDHADLMKVNHLGISSVVEVENALWKWTEKNCYGACPPEVKKLIKKMEEEK